jgi:hypothetical protein
VLIISYSLRVNFFFFLRKEVEFKAKRLKRKTMVEY